jgi:hypothetical protein
MKAKMSQADAFAGGSVPALAATECATCAGDTTNSDVKAASLAVYDKIKGNFTGKIAFPGAAGPAPRPSHPPHLTPRRPTHRPDVTNGQPVVLSKGGLDYKAGGGVSLSAGAARDLPGTPADTPQNTLMEVESFGGTNRSVAGRCCEDHALSRTPEPPPAAAAAAQWLRLGAPQVRLHPRPDAGRGQHLQHPGRQRPGAPRGHI